MNSKVKQFLVFFIGWPLSLVSIYIIIVTFLPKISQIQSSLTNINYYLLITGIFSFLVYYFLRSLIWQDILNQKKYNLPFNKSNLLWTSAEFKRYIPGNIWSFLGRTILFSNKGIHKKDIAKLFLFELQFILSGAVIIALFSFPYLTKIFRNFNKFNITNLLLNLAGILIFLLIVFHSIIIDRTKGKLNTLLLEIFPKYTPVINIRILFKSCLAFLFFGLGYFLTISSIIFIDSTLVLTLSGFFVFALLIGLFSFITPAGLGIREGMVTYGLKFIMPLHLAGFASLFGRINLVIAEILYLVLSYIYSELNKDLVLATEKLIFKYKNEVILLFAIATFNLYFIPISFLRHDNFYTGRFDLGNMDQTVWNTINGRIFEFTNPDGTQNLSRLAFHADFILILISPLYLLWNNPKMLLLIQSIIVSLGAIFIYLLSLKIINSSYRKLALFISLSYLLNPSLQWSILYDFHSVTLATTLLLGAYYFILNKKYINFLFFALLSAITKEQLWLPVSLMGLFIGVSNIKIKINLFRKISINKLIRVININYRNLLFGLLICIFSLIIFYFLISVAIPKASSTNSYFALSYFNNDADNTTHLIKNLFSSPFSLILKLVHEDRVLYYLALLEPLGYIPILAPYMLIFAAADLFLNLLADRSTLYQIYYQYTAVITPFLYLGLIYGISNLLKATKVILNNKNIDALENKLNSTIFKLILRYQKNDINRLIVNFITIYILLSAFNGAYKYGPLPWTKKPNIAMLNFPQNNKHIIKHNLELIPESSSVSSTNNLGAHLSHRQNLYTIPHATNSADYVVFLIRPNSPHIDKDLALQLQTNTDYKLIKQIDDFLMFKKINK